MPRTKAAKAVEPLPVPVGDDTPRTGSAAPRMTVYYWPRGFVLLAPSFVLDRRRAPYRRLSATLMFALAEPFTLETGTDDALTARAVLIAPKVARRRVTAAGSDLVIADIGLATPEFDALAPLLVEGGVRELDAALLLPFAADYRRALAGELPEAELQGLLARSIEAVSGRAPQAPALHPRIGKVLELIQDWPLPHATLERLAERVHLSASRLRHLFADEMGSSLSHYLRWTAVWKAVWLWSRGRPLIDVAVTVGFHDVAHLNRAYNEVFGMNPSASFDPKQVCLKRCVWG